MEFSYSSSKLIVDKFLLEETLNKKNNFKILNIKPGAFLSKTTSKRKDKNLISTTQLANTIYKLSSQEESIYISSIEIFGSK
jgi:NADP-dependent 3-hydroxy acid dehydrogenase YdfG